MKENLITAHHETLFVFKATKLTLRETFTKLKHVIWLVFNDSHIPHAFDVKAPRIRDCAEWMVPYSFALATLLAAVQVIEVLSILLHHTFVFLADHTSDIF